MPQLTVSEGPERDAPDSETHAQHNPLEVFDVIAVFDRLEVPAIGETLTVVDELGAFGSPGLRLEGDRFSYVLAVDGPEGDEPEDETPAFRLERWSGSTHKRVLVATRVIRDSSGTWTIPEDSCTVLRPDVYSSGLNVGGSV